jgi:hypothetical protein
LVRMKKSASETGESTELYERADWTLFRTIGTLSQLSGVPPERLRRLVVKELADNALDATGQCRVGEMPGEWFFVEDDGHGIGGSPEEVARMFSFGRPLVSSKIKRLPRRGALGNGLRVVAGAVFASGGELRVITRSRVHVLRPLDSGETEVRVEPAEGVVGTRVEVRFGDAVPEDTETLAWARVAINAAGAGPIYARKTSAWWYDSDGFFELLKAAGKRTVRDVMIDFEGCSGHAGALAEQLRGRPAASVSIDEAEDLLLSARDLSSPVKPSRLALLNGALDGAWAKITGSHSLRPGRGKLGAELPFTVEAWCRRPTDARDAVTMLVNRTPVASDVTIERLKEKTNVGVFGCNLAHKFAVGRKPVDLVLNVQIPYMPITSNGKEPDLKHFIKEIAAAIEKAAARCQRLAPAAKPPKQNDLILGHLPASIEHAGGAGEYRFSLRQLYYAVRERVLKTPGAREPTYDWFGKVVAEHENTVGDIPKMYRDDRGVLYHPHLRTEIPLGTMAVEQYQRPPWTFNKIIYCEKEGFFPILRAASWPERHDCALLTSKGQATKAAKDVLDYLGETQEKLDFFVIADADAYVQALREATRSRGRRSVEIVNLGLLPDEGVRMGLPVEHVKRGKRRKPVGSHIDEEWAEWLQKYRIELNAMTTPQFIGWLDQKMADHSGGKVVPPAEVMKCHLATGVRGRVDAAVRERILRDAHADEQVEAALTLMEPAVRARAADLEAIVRAGLEQTPTDSWRAPVDRLAEDLSHRPG